MREPSPLPKGRHALPPEEVERIHRERIMLALVETLQVRGYAGTSVSQVCRAAGISRESFYRLHDSKLGCFLDALDVVGHVLVSRLSASFDGPGSPLERFERGIRVYLEAIAAESGHARLFLVETHAAGREAAERRMQLQADLAAHLAELFGASSAHDEFECRMLVAAVSGLIAGPVIAEDPAGILALADPVVRHASRMLDAGTFRASSEARR